MLRRATHAQFLAYFIVGLALQLIAVYLKQFGWIALSQEQAANLAAGAAFPMFAYGMVAGWLATIYWYKALKTMEQLSEPASAAVPVATFS